MPKYEVYHEDDSLFMHVANVEAVDVRQAFELTAFGNADHGWHENEGVEVLRHDCRASFYGDIIIAPDGSEHIYTVTERNDGEGHHSGFEKTTIIRDQTDRLNDMADQWMDGEAEREIERWYNDYERQGYQEMGIEPNRKLETMFRDIANPPDFEAIAQEIRIDAEAARLRDGGEDYETYLRIASMRPANDNERSMER